MAARHERPSSPPLLFRAPADDQARDRAQSQRPDDGAPDSGRRDQSATVAHADAVAEAFRVAGITAATVSGDMPARGRADLIGRFDRGDVQVLTNCMVLTSHMWK